MRRPATVVAVALPEKEGKPAGPKPSPFRRGAEPEPDIVFVEVNRRRVLAATVFAPSVVVLTALGLVINSARLGFDLSGGHLLPVGSLGEMWSTYLASWQDRKSVV